MRFTMEGERLVMITKMLYDDDLTMCCRSITLSILQQNEKTLMFFVSAIRLMHGCVFLSTLSTYVRITILFYHCCDPPTSEKDIWFITC